MDLGWLLLLLMKPNLIFVYTLAFPLQRRNREQSYPLLETTTLPNLDRDTPDLEIHLPLIESFQHKSVNVNYPLMYQLSYLEWPDNCCIDPPTAECSWFTRRGGFGAMTAALSWRKYLMVDFLAPNTWPAWTVIESFHLEPVVFFPSLGLPVLGCLDFFSMALRWISKLSNTVQRRLGAVR